MSAQPVDSPTPAADVAVSDGEHSYVFEMKRPYAEVSTDALVDSLETQYEQSQALEPDMVFEIAARLIHAEGLGVIAPG